MNLPKLIVEKNTSNEILQWNDAIIDPLDKDASKDVVGALVISFDKKDEEGRTETIHTEVIGLFSDVNTEAEMYDKVVDKLNEEYQATLVRLTEEQGIMVNINAIGIRDILSHQSSEKQLNKVLDSAKFAVNKVANDNLTH